MKIAILGWGSPIWDPKSLRLDDGVWHPDGPLLPIEFARTPPAELSPVLCAEPWVLNVQTFWTQSACDDIRGACGDLAAREEILPEQIGYLNRNDGQRIAPLISADGAHELTDIVRDRIGQWLQANQDFDAVIWIDSRANWGDRQLPPPPTSADRVVEYLGGLTGDAASKSQQNLQSAPFSFGQLSAGGWRRSPTGGRSPLAGSGLPTI